MIIRLDSLSQTSIKNNFMTYISNQENALVWMDFFETSTGTTLLEILAGWGAYISYLATVNRREAFLMHAENRTSLIGISENLGYSVSRGRNEIRELKVNPTNTLIIPPFTVVGKCKDYDIVTTEEVKLNKNVPSNIKVYIGNLKSESITIDTNKLVVFRFESPNVSDSVKLSLNGTVLPVSTSLEDLVDDKYVAISNPYGAVDVMYLNKGAYNYNPSNDLVLEYIDLIKLEFDLKDIDFDYGEVLESINTYPYIEPETKDNIRVNAPLHHETQAKIRGRKDYLKTFRSLGYNFKDTNDSNYSPSIVNLAYLKDNFTLLTPTEKAEAIARMMIKRAMGVAPPFITDPRHVKVILDVVIKKQDIPTEFTDVERDVRNVVEGYLSKKLAPEVDLYLMEHDIEDLSYVKTARVEYHAETWKASTKYRLGDFVEPISQNGKIYRAIDFIAPSGVSEPAWDYDINTVIQDNNLQWRCIHRYGAPIKWRANKTYKVGDTVVPTIENRLNKGIMYELVEILRKSGTTQPAWNPQIQSFTEDGDLIWVCKNKNTTDPAWRANTIYRKGDSIAVGNFSYECVGYKGTSGNSQPDWKTTQKYLISGVNTANKEFYLAGNHVDKYVADDIVRVRNSSSNNGYYTVVDSAYFDGKTIIAVAENIPSNTVDGYLYMEHLNTSDNGILWSVHDPIDVLTYRWNEYLVATINLTLSE